MKTLWITLSAIAILAFAGCNQRTEVNEMLDDPRTRNEIYSEIVNNHQLMTEFMKKIRSNEHGMTMMEGYDRGMMDMENMHETASMFMQDSVACDHLTDSIMNHHEVMEMMLNKMHNRGFMDKECMEESKEKLENAGLPEFDFGNIRHWR